MLYLQFFVSFLSFTLVYARPGVKHGANVKGLGLPINNAGASNIIPNKYIVVYYNNVTDDDVNLHQLSVMTTMRKRGMDTAACRAISMMGWRAMAMEADDEGLVIDIASASQVSRLLQEIKLWLISPGQIR